MKILRSRLTSFLFVAFVAVGFTVSVTVSEAALHGHNGQGAGNGGHKSPTGIPGDNTDDPHSGKFDCLGDGDSGLGNDDRNCPLIPPDDGGGD